MCTVGDVVTQNAFFYQIRPDIAVIDGFTKRSACISTPEFDGHVLHVSNPAGTITDELIAALRKATDMRPCVVVVDGEEDLAVLPLVEMLPDSAVILYGQPDEGVVVCEVNDSLRSRSRDLLSHFSGL
ncbi:MAG: GTP-dependent dephospho-CoA kinase family protein [Methanocorpusculum sp.]|nr:GTP-dependent dephospho-CoA kinase family protein [Methanocorpusculum sp.]